MAWLTTISFVACAGSVRAGDDSDLRRQLGELQKQNAELQRIMEAQQSALNQLSRQVAELKSGETVAKDESTSSKAAAGWGLGQTRIGGQGAVGFFSTEREGNWPNHEFRVDEAQLTIESPIWNDVYVYSEINLAQRYDSDLGLSLSELYLDFENVSKLWNHDGQLNVRVGRFDIPFGEEYLSRDVFDNPLISRSITDLWGVDEGIEVYGALGPVNYVFAVQNGSAAGGADYNADKSVTAKAGWDPMPWLHWSVSAMRTGDVDAMRDYLSELWIGSGWFRSIGSMAATKFHANLLETDARVRLAHGHLKAFAGIARYDDNDPAAENRRDIWYYGIEAEHRFTRKLYSAVRFSQIFADGGYPLTGFRPLDDFFSGAVMTDRLWRLSAGVGYRFSDRLVIKTEYSFEGGRETNGDQRDQENFFGAEAAFKF